MIDDIIEETREEIIRTIREESSAAAISKIGSMGTICSLIILILVAAAAILTRFLHIEHIALNLITKYGPGIAGAFGMVSSGATYYGWFRILRGKKKLKLKEEGTGEAQNKFADFIQSLPDLIGSFFNNMVSQASTVALGAAVAVSTVAYVPAVNKVFNRVVDSAEKTISSKIKRSMQMSGTQTDGIQTAGTQNIIGKLNLRSGTGKKEQAIVNLISEGRIISRIYADSDGNYAFYNLPPGNYSVNVQLAGYEETSRADGTIELSPIKNAEEKTVKIAEPKKSLAQPKSPLQKEKPLPPMPEPPKPEPESESKQESKQKPKPEPVARPNAAKQSGFFVGAGSELNNNSPRKGSTAMAGNVVLGYDLSKSFALGVNTIYSYDMDATSTLESKILLRYYFPVMSSFLQAEGGGAMSAIDGKNSLAPQGGLTAGLRLEIEKNWYLEPTLRGGYPFVLGTGLTLGKSFK
ncbi:MAG: hypothetical protein FWB90_08815 [Fibromonadales bacterium]|nr:hypothetical protein [Fibromonadales bacterium]